jgi:hypothetical protein
LALARNRPDRAGRRVGVLARVRARARARARVRARVQSLFELKQQTGKADAISRA